VDIKKGGVRGYWGKLLHEEFRDLHFPQSGIG